MEKYLNKVIQGDCLEVMKDMPDKSVDLVLTSPPYNLGFSHHTGSKHHDPYLDDIPEKEYQTLQKKMLIELFRITKGSGSLIYNHKNRFKDGVCITPYSWILETPWILKQEIVWFNGSQNFDKRRFYPMTERLYWLSKNPKTILKNVINHHDIFNWNSTGVDNIHSRAFPIEMAQDLISCFPDAEIILDPFGGSCTTAVAAENLKRKWICIEKEEKYVKICNDRIAALTQSMF